MARKSMTTLKSEANSRLPDNTTGNISPADVRETRIDFLDTMTPGYCAQTIDPEVTGVAVGTTFQNISQWNNQVQLDPEFSFAVGTGTVTSNVQMAIEFQVNLTLEFAANRQISIQSVSSSGPYNWSSDIDGAGAGNPVNISLAGFYAHGATDTLEIQIVADTATTVDFKKGAFLSILRPVINDIP